MKRRLTALALCAAVLLTGCSSMLERSYTSETLHDRTPSPEGDSSVLMAEDYRDLVSAVYYVVSQSLPTGTIRLNNYTRDVESDLAAACLEVVEDDPLGAYAVEFIKYDYTHIVSYYEATVSVTYRRTAEQVANIVSATGNSAIRTELQEALTDFRPELALRISNFTEGTDLNQLLREAYYSMPASALGLPEAEINVYPDHGAQRIVEVLLTYPMTREEAQERGQALRERAQTLLEPYGGQPALQDLIALAQRETVYDPEGGSTAYDALTGRAADSEGLALALALLCGQAGDPDCQVVSGTLEDGTPRFWNQIRLNGGTYYLDLAGDGTLSTGEELYGQGYRWADAPVPEPPAQEETPPEENSVESPAAE